MVTVLLWFILYFEAISKYEPPRAYIRRNYLTEDFLRFEFGGFIFTRGLYMERFIFGILQYKISIPHNIKQDAWSVYAGCFS